MAAKKTLVIGASENTNRYSFLAVNRLLDHGHEVLAIGAKPGKIRNIIIDSGFPDYKDIDTVTLYLSKKNQQAFYKYIIDLHPRRLIFNPGAENDELYALAKKNHIEPIEACTLVMLATGEY